MQQGASRVFILTIFHVSMLHYQHAIITIAAVVGGIVVKYWNIVVEDYFIHDLSHGVSNQTAPYIWNYGSVLHNFL